MKRLDSFLALESVRNVCGGNYDIRDVRGHPSSPKIAVYSLKTYFTHDSDQGQRASVERRQLF